MRFLLDTDTASYSIRGASAALDARLAKITTRDVAISVVTRAELLFGVEKRGNPRGLTRVVHAFLDRTQYYLGTMPPRMPLPRYACNSNGKAHPSDLPTP